MNPFNSYIGAYGDPKANPKTLDIGYFALDSRIRHMFRYIQKGNADKAAEMAQLAARVIHGKWRTGVVLKGLDKGGKRRLCNGI